MGRRLPHRDDIRIPPRPNADGSFNTVDLRAWLFGSGDAGAYMVGNALSHRRIKDGDLLIPGGEGDYRVGGVAMFVWASEIPDDDMELIAAGVVILNSLDEVRVMVNGEEWEVASDRYSYTVPVVGWVPVSRGVLDLGGARALPTGGAIVTPSAPRADMATIRRNSLKNLLQDEIPF